MDVPLFATGFQNTQYDWADFMEFQPNVATGLKDYRMAWPKGRALGGTSVINYMIYTRGNRWDYDTWAEQGNPGKKFKIITLIPFNLNKYPQRTSLRLTNVL